MAEFTPSLPVVLGLFLVRAFLNQMDVPTRSSDVMAVVADPERPARLRPDEWTSGDIFWLIDAVGAGEAVRAMVEQLGEAVFKGKPFKLRARDGDGKMSVQTVGAGGEGAGD